MLPYTLTYDTVDGITAFVSGPGLPADGTDYMLATEAERMRGVACSAYLAGMRRVQGIVNGVLHPSSPLRQDIDATIASLEKELADADRT